VQRDRTDRYQSPAASESGIPDDEPEQELSFLSGDGTLQKDAIRGSSVPIIQRWERDGTVDSIRTRMSIFLGASIAVIVLQQAVSFEGFSQTVVNVWALTAVPTGVVAACIRSTLRDPERAGEIWLNQETMAAIGVISLAVLARGGRQSAIGRVAWQMLFGEDRPEGIAGPPGTDDSTVDESSVQELKQFLFLGIVGSGAILVFEQLLVGNRWDIFDASGQSTDGNPLDGFGGFDVFSGFGPVEWLFISAGMVLVGTILGAVLAVSRP
jgi:hypothetical protein